MAPRPNTLYRVRTLDADGNPADVQTLLAYGDEDARNRTLRLENRFGLELWKRGALVDTVFPDPGSIAAE